MLCLERKYSNKIDVCEALLRRGVISQNDTTLLEDLLWRSLRGMDGELKSDKFWADLRL